MSADDWLPSDDSGDCCWINDPCPIHNPSGVSLRETFIAATMERVGCDREEAGRIVDRVADKL